MALAPAALPPPPTALPAEVSAAPLPNAPVELCRRPPPRSSALPSHNAVAPPSAGQVSSSNTPPHNVVAPPLRPSAGRVSPPMRWAAAPSTDTGISWGEREAGRSVGSVGGREADGSVGSVRSVSPLAADRTCTRSPMPPACWTRSSRPSSDGLEGSTPRPEGIRVVPDGSRPIHGEAEPPASAVVADLLFQPLSVCLGEAALSSLTAASALHA